MFSSCTWERQCPSNVKLISLPAGSISSSKQNSLTAAIVLESLMPVNPTVGFMSAWPKETNQHIMQSAVIHRGYNLVSQNKIISIDEL